VKEGREGEKERGREARGREAGRQRVSEAAK
jgi:hypothetical protein